jgi:F0F1-type ATP synthase assembly protein I
MKKNTFSEIFYKNAGYLAVLMVSLAYIAGSFLLISTTGKSVYEIIAGGIISMIVGILINGVFRSLGLRRGEEDERTISTSNLYAQAIDSVVCHIDKLQDFCDEENVRALSTIRKKILARAGMKYSDCFDEDGTVKSFDYELYSDTEIENASKRKRRKYLKVNSQRKRAYNKAVNVKIKLLSPATLTSDDAKENDPFNFGKSKKEYSTQRNLSDMISRILMAIIFGYFGVSFVSEVNPALLIWNTMQIIMYITSGIIQMYSSFAYIVDEHRQSVIKRIDYLQKFKIYAENAPKPNISS